MKKLLYILALVLTTFSCENVPTSENKKETITKETIATLIDTTNKPVEQPLITDRTDSLGEYTSYNIYLSIETTDGIQNGYTSISTHYLNRDSLQNSEYLKMALKDKWNNTDSLIYFKNRISYLYGGCFNDVIGEEKQKVYYLLDRTAIPLSIIKNIKIKNIFVDHNLQGIANSLTLKDTNWINNKPIRCVNFGGYLCYFNLYIYEESKLTTDIINKANSILSKYDGDELDKKLHEVIGKLDGQKVIIIRECTC